MTAIEVEHFNTVLSLALETGSTTLSIASLSYPCSGGVFGVDGLEHSNTSAIADHSGKIINQNEVITAGTCDALCSSTDDAEWSARIHVQRALPVGVARALSIATGSSASIAARSAHQAPRRSMMAPEYRATTIQTTAPRVNRARSIARSE